MSGEKSTDVRKIASRRRDADAGEDWILPHVMAEIVEVVRTFPVDVLVPQILDRQRR